MDDPDRLVPRNSVIADRDVDVPHAQAPGPLDVRQGPIDGDDGPDPEPLQGGEAVITLGLAAAVKPRTEAEEVLDSLDVNGLGLRSRPRGRPLSRLGAPVSFVSA